MTFNLIAGGRESYTFFVSFLGYGLQHVGGTRSMDLFDATAAIATQAPATMASA
jgi:hypothetical protein